LVELQKSVLHDFLGQFASPQQTEGIAEQRAFLFGKDLFKRPPGHRRGSFTG
jgi:hypothetical protein